jgi:hypothetical protein
MWSYKMYVVGIVGLARLYPKGWNGKALVIYRRFTVAVYIPSALNNKGPVEMGFFRFRFLDHHRASKHKHLNAATIAI